VCETRIGKIGMAICYDMRFPEIFRLMAKGGAQVICVPADFTMNTGKDHWEALLRARAIENSCYIIAPGQTGQKPEFQAYGKSMVIDPWGNIIAKASDREQIIYAQIDLEYIDEIRRQIPSLHNIREDIYHLTSHNMKFYREEAL
ncbi:MAG TPA: nitrilase-related carbon-nitrogen hydrolase, partial [Lachnospiraceae bacterium]|nr:nitrilase-related carbon-nitrogen hydrolase [Lachnospiraceae bacterium]